MLWEKTPDFLISLLDLLEASMAIKKSLFSFTCAALSLLSQLSYGSQETTFATLEEEYTPKYCLQLEAAYGDGMMSEGGAEGIQHLFEGVALEGKKALDIGCGLGGVAHYLAKAHAMEVTGVEVNPWMVMEANRRIPEHLRGKLVFLLTTSNSDWLLPSNSFDIIYSKGVLTHLETKDEVFQECQRLLKDDGLLVINDWLSSEDKKWGENIAKLVELENLALYPESETGYREAFERGGFKVLSVRDESPVYLRFNQEIASRLRDPARRSALLEIFTEEELEASIVGYESIAKAIETEELRVLRFTAQKGP